MGGGLVLLWILTLVGHPQLQSFNRHNAFVYRSDCEHIAQGLEMDHHHRDKFRCQREEVPYQALSPPLKEELHFADYIHKGKAQWHDPNSKSLTEDEMKTITGNGGIYGEVHSNAYQPVPKTY